MQSLFHFNGHPEPTERYFHRLLIHIRMIQLPDLFNMPDFTKPGRRELSELASIAYEAEAHRMLERLDAEFER